MDFALTGLAIGLIRTGRLELNRRLKKKKKTIDFLTRRFTYFFDQLNPHFRVPVNLVYY